MATIRVYLKNTEKNPIGGWGSNKSIDFIIVDGVKLTQDHSTGRYYISLSENEEILEKLLPNIDEITAIDWVKNSPHREAGIYRRGQARAKVEYSASDNPNEFCLVITKATSMDQIRHLLVKIKTGTIRPTVSFEGQQQGRSYKDLERELARANETVESQIVLRSQLDARLRELEHDLDVAERTMADLQSSKEELEEQLGAAKQEVAHVGQQHFDTQRDKDGIKERLKVLGVQLSRRWNPFLTRGGIQKKLDEIVTLYK